MNKKILSFVLSMLLVGGALAGCSNAPQGTSSNASGASGASKETYDVAFLSQNQATESMAYAAKMFQKHCADYGLNLTVMDDKGDPSVEAQNVNTAVAQGVKAIIINPNDPNAIVPSLMAAKKAGVVVCLFSSDLAPENQKYRDFFCGANDEQAGELAGEQFVKQFPNGANIVEIGGKSGQDVQIKRHDGFVKAIKGSKIQVIDTQNCTDWAANECMNIMQDLIVKHSGKIQGIYCQWDNGYTGCIQAMEHAKIDPSSIFSVAIDGCKGGFDQVKAGTQTVSLMQNFDTMADTTLSLCRKVIDGEKVDSVNYITWDIVNKDTINNFPYPEW